MRSIIVAGLAAAGLLAAAPAMASEQLAKDAGCVKCHDATKKKAGPSLKELAAKYKGKSSVADKLVADIKAGKDDHPVPKASDADLKAIVNWMLQ